MKKRILCLLLALCLLAAVPVNAFAAKNIVEAMGGELPEDAPLANEEKPEGSPWVIIGMFAFAFYATGSWVKKKEEDRLRTGAPSPREIREKLEAERKERLKKEAEERAARWAAAKPGDEVEISPGIVVVKGEGPDPDEEDDGKMPFDLF